MLSGNGETLEGLQKYLARAGVKSRGVLRPSALLQQTHGVHAVVAFPDDFDANEAADALSELQHRDGDIALVLVTAKPAWFSGIGATDSRRRVVLLPRPAWSWTILDVLRGLLPEGLDDPA